MVIEIYFGPGVFCQRAKVIMTVPAMRNAIPVLGFLSGLVEVRARSPNSKNSGPKDAHAGYRKSRIGNVVASMDLVGWRVILVTRSPCLHAG